LILIGHSLWWMFLLKYLWENKFPKKIKQLHLVATVIDGSDRPKEKQYLWDFAFDLNIIPKAEDAAEEIFIYHSTDDPTVPYSQAEKIKSYLPKAKLITFTDMGHFRQLEFPELLANIRAS
jgi:predicted alpha/beta hydrolase family esterase